jgi:hypothetical protein
MRLLIPLLTLLSLLAPVRGLAKHVAPPRVEPVIHEGVRYVVPNDKGRRAYVEAWDTKDGQKLWTKTVFKRWYVPLFGTECMQYDYIAAIELQAGRLRITSERGREFTLDIRTQAVRRVRPLTRRVASSCTNYSCWDDAGALPPVLPLPTAGTAMTVGTD